MTNHVKFFQSWRSVLAAVLIVVALPWTIGAARRNRAYLHLLRGDANAGTSAGDDLLVLRGALERGDWPMAAEKLARTSGPDRLAALLVIHEADRRVKARDLAGGRAALAVVSADAGRDPALWYRIGEVYERTGVAKDAVAAYERGDAVDPASPWTQGRYRIAMIHQHEKQWQAVADLLGPLLINASDQEIVRRINSFDVVGPAWQEAFLTLGQAYHELGKAAEEEATYERVSRIAAPRRDWTLNRALVNVAAARRAHGDVAPALEPLRQALDVATELDVSYRRTYELDTAAEADRLVDQARREGRIDGLRAAADDLVRGAVESPGAWYLRGLANEASCDVDRARSDYGRAAALVGPGSGAFLAGRPAGPPKGPCPSK